jgi:CHAT domain-containing protein
MAVDLAVFSACSTASFDETDTVLPSSLAEAALIAGARRVVGTLWDIDSAASARFNESFYSFLRQGQSPARALQSAAGYLRGQVGYQHPYYWAPFVVYQSIDEEN